VRFLDGGSDFLLQSSKASARDAPGDGVMHHAHDDALGEPCDTLSL